jgi:gliding motility-associated-like protein
MVNCLLLKMAVSVSRKRDIPYTGVLGVYMFFLALLFTGSHMVLNAQVLPEINACHGCNYTLDQSVLFFDDGGKVNPVSEQWQTTTFKSRSRRGEKLSLYFTSIDIPPGAAIKVYYGDNGSEEMELEIFTHLRKTRNIIAEEIRVEYLPSTNPNIAAGWSSRIDVFYYTDPSTLIKPESDCPYAIPLCSNNTVIALGGQYTDIGAINDDGGSCYGNYGSGGSVWYTFTPLTNGPIDFTITPQGTTDYDFVVWDITNGCANGQRIELACNYSLYTGQTGLSGSKCNEWVGDCSWNDCSNQSKAADCNRFNNRVNVATNKKYALSINFYSGSNDGFILKFQNETGSVAITDNVPPTITNAYSNNCMSATNFQVTFSEWVDCSTLQNNDFTLPGHTFTITNNYCIGNKTNKVALAVSPALGPGTWNMNATNILDLCGNMMNSNYAIVLGNPPNPNISAPTQVCKNPGTGGGFAYAPNSQTLTASGGNSYIWSTGQTSASISVSPRNTTTYTVDAIRGACVASASTTVTVVQASAVSLGPDKFYCGGPAVVLTTTPQIPGHTYQFFRNPTATGNGVSIQNNGPNPSVSVSPASTTTYRVIVTDLNGCKARADVKVIVASGSTATINNPGNNFCKNSIPIQLTAIPEGGTFTGPGIVGDMFDPALAGVGTHTIYYEATNECGTFTASRNIQVMNANTAITFNLPSLFCVTDADTVFIPNPRCGTFFGNGIVNSGVCSGTTYGPQKPTFSPSIAGVGTHIITYDPPVNQGCTGSMVVTVVGEGYEPTISGLNGPYCANAANVALTGFPAGGVFAGPGISGNTFSPANAGVGSHNITYTIAKCGESYTKTVAVEVLSSSPTGSISYPGSPFCFSLNTPQSVIQSGTPGGTYSASPAGLSINSSTGAITPNTSTPGNYTVTYAIPAGSGCPAFSTSAPVTITNSITPTFTAIASICSGAVAPTLPVISNNGIAGTWSPATVNNTTSATYTFTANPGQCATTTTLSVTVTSNATPSFNPIAPICSGAAAPTLPGTSTNNITGTWSPPTVNNTASGTYNFTPTVGQCASGTSLSVTVNPNVTPTFNSIAPFCSGTTAPMLPGTSSNSIAGTWSPATVSTSTSGTYNFTPIAGQCASIASLSVTVKPVFTSNVSAQICSGQTYTLPDGTTVSAAGAFPATLTASNGCDSVVTTNLTINSTINTTTNATICQGNTYVLPDGSVVSSSGTYTYTFTPPSGCDSIVTTNLTVNPTFSTSVNASICSGQAYTLPDGSTVSTAGAHPVTLSAVTGCDSVVTTNLTVNPTLSSTTNAAICQGDSYMLPDGSSVSVASTYTTTLGSTVTGCDSVVTTNLTVNPIYNTSVNAQICTGQTYTLPDGSVVSAANSYPVTLSSVNGCDSVVTINLAVNSTLTSTTNATICQGDTYTLPDGSVVSSSGTYTYTFTLPSGCDSIVTTNLTANPTFSTSVNASICSGQTYTLPDGSVVSAANSYPVTLSSVKGCDSVVTTNLTVNTTVNTTTNAIICQGDTYTLPDGSVVSAGGTFIHSFTSPSGCDSIVTTNLTVKPNPVVNLGPDKSYCEGDVVTLDAEIIADNYLWNTGEVSSSITVSKTDIYSVVVTTDGCTAYSEIALSFDKQLPGPYYLGPDTTICDGDNFIISLSAQPGVTYTWQDGTTSSSFSTNLGGTYYVTAVNDCGSYTDTIVVLTAPCEACGVYIPTAFTPNGDGINDQFMSLTTCDDILPFRFSVFNRWYEMVFETDQPGIGWDGTYKGQAQPLDVYVYYVSYFDKQLQKVILQKGIVNLLR